MSRRVRVTTPSRLHFGLLGWGPHASRQFGGVGLMVDRPGLELQVQEAREWAASGPLAARLLEVAHRVACVLAGEGVRVPPLELKCDRAAAEHAGMGTGTQVSLAVARAVAVASGAGDPGAERAAAWTGRGARSGIGLHGHAHGGMIVDGGRGGRGGIPPLLARAEFPEQWHALVVCPGAGGGLSGQEERSAFARLEPPPRETSDRLCRLVLLELLPAVHEADLTAFGAALEEIQNRVGRAFALAQQGRIYATTGGAEAAQAMREAGLVGVGQSSWGPTVYGFSDRAEHEREATLDEVKRRCRLGDQALFWTGASPTGAVLIAE